MTGLTVPMVDQGPTAGFVDVDLSFEALKRTRGWLVLGVAAGLVLALLFALAQPNSHRSWATVLVKPIGVDLTRSSNATVDPIVERELARSFIVAERAARQVGVAADDVEEVRELRRNLTVRSVESRPILEFSIADTDAEYARDVAGAFAESYLEVRLEQADRSIQESLVVLQARRAEVQAELTAIEQELVDTPVESAEFRAGINTQAVLISQVISLDNDIARLDSLALDPGQVISPAQLSQSSTRARLIPIVLAGSMLGGLLGLIAALFRDRRQRQDRLEDGELERHGVPAVGHIPRRVGGADTYASLRRSVASTLVENQAKVVGVTTISQDGPPAQVATWLAMSLGQEHRVLLISADFAGRNLSNQLGIGDAPGLLEALAGGKTIADVRHRHGVIDVVGAGQTDGDPDFLVRLVGLTGFLDSGRDEYDYIVVSAPGVLDTSTSHLATFATDGVLLVLDDADGRTRVAKAASLLRRSGGDVLGSIVLTDSAVAAEE